jgi:hypothetical protein
MGWIEFLVLVVVVALLGSLAIWFVKLWAPEFAPIATKVILTIGIIIIVVMLLQATGILSHDPKIPRL